MGFWSSIGSIAGDIVGGGAGSAISKIGQVADVVAPVISNSGKTAAQNQQLKYAQNLEANKQQTGTNDQLALAAQIADTNAKTGAANTAIAEQAAQDAARKNAFAAAMKGALAKNIQDVTFDTSQFKTAVPNVSFQGGLRPSAFGAEGRAAGATMNTSGQNSLMNPPTFPTVTAPSKFQLTDPTVPAPPNQTLWEKLAGPISLGLTATAEAAKGASANAPITPELTRNNGIPQIGGTAATGATVTDQDLLQFLQNHPQIAAAASAAQPPPSPAMSGVTFGPGVTPAPGLTFEPQGHG